jgi:hypothetical protein
MSKVSKKDVLEAIVELAAKSISKEAIKNMSPVTLTYGNLKFDVGTEDLKKRKHVHVISPEGKIKFWLQLNGERCIEPSKEQEKRIPFYQEALDQLEVYYDDIVANIDRYYKGDPADPVNATVGQKTKGQNSPKAVKARQATEDQRTPS